MEKRRIKIKSQKIKKILKFLSLPIIFFIVLFVCLKYGIHIEKLNFSTFHVEQLYIKLDKKLILEAKKIAISENINSQNTNKGDLDLNNIAKLLKEFKYLYLFFQKINIDEILINDYPVEFLYEKESFYINSKNLLAQIEIDSKYNKIQANIKDFVFKDYNISISGAVLVNTATKFYNFKGKIYSEFFKSDIKISSKRDELFYELSSASTNDIGKIFRFLDENGIDLPKNLATWVGGKVKGEFYFIEKLNGFLDFGKNRFYLDDIKASGYVSNLSVVLDKNIDPISSPLVRLAFNKQKLDFAFEELKFNNYDLSKSEIYIENMLNDKANITINIKSDNARLDYRINKILLLYDIKLPFLQNTGLTKTKLKLNIPFSHPEKISYYGNFQVLKSNINLMDFRIEKADIVLDNDKVKILNADVLSQMLKADINASLNLKQKKANIDLFAKDMNLPQDSLSMQNKLLNFELDFDKNISFYNDEFKTTASLEDGLKIHILRLAKLKDYSKLMQKSGIFDAELFLNTKDYKEFEVDLNNTTFESFLLYKDNNPYEYDNFKLRISEEDFNLTSASDVLYIEKKDKKMNIFLNNMNLLFTNKNAKHALDDADDFLYEFLARNVDVVLQDFNKTLNFDFLKANFTKKQMQINANKNLSNFEAFFNSEKFSLKATKMNDEFINHFMRKDVVEDGVFDLYMDGNSTEFFRGKFLFSNTYLKDLKFHQQLLSFINTIPNLLLFKAPTFNEKGFNIENAGISFYRKKDLFEIDALNLNGDSADILGTAKINLRNYSIDGLLELRTLKSASSVISKVPIVNQVLLGKDRQISTQIKVEGFVDNPQFKTQLIAQGLQLPYNLIKNIFELPTNLIK